MMPLIKIKIGFEKKPRKFGLILTLLFITLIADAFIGYKISYGIHNNEFNAGLTNEQWKFDMIFSDINFYLVAYFGICRLCYLGVSTALRFKPHLDKTESEKSAANDR